MQVADFFHTQPAEFGAAHRAGHVVARAVVHLDYQDLTPRTRLDVVSCRTKPGAARVSHYSALLGASEKRWQRLSLEGWQARALFGNHR